MEKYIITFLFLVLLTLGFKASADTQEALDVAKEKGLVDLTPSEPEIGIVFAVCIFDDSWDGWLLIDTLFFETLILVSFSVISISVRLNSSK